MIVTELGAGYMGKTPPLRAPLDVTAEELTIESLFPADDATDRWFREGFSAVVAEKTV